MTGFRDDWQSRCSGMTFLKDPKLANGYLFGEGSKNKMMCKSDHL